MENGRGSQISGTPGKLSLHIRLSHFESQLNEDENDRFLLPLIKEWFGERVSKINFCLSFLFASSSQRILEGDGLSCCVRNTSSRNVDSPFGCGDNTGRVSTPSFQVTKFGSDYGSKISMAKGPQIFIKVDPFLEGSHTFSAISTRFSRVFKHPNRKATNRCGSDSTQAIAIKESCSNGGLTEAEFDRWTVRCILSNSCKQA